jgi:hypothetical protein
MIPAHNFFEVSVSGSGGIAGCGNGILRCWCLRRDMRMQRTIWTVATLGLIALLVVAAPDIKRYMRMRSM